MQQRRDGWQISGFDSLRVTWRYNVIEGKSGNTPKGMCGSMSLARVHLYKLTFPCLPEMGDNWNIDGNSRSEANGLASVAGVEILAISIQSDYR